MDNQSNNETSNNAAITLTFAPYDAKAPIAPATGNRLSKVQFRGDQAKKFKPVFIEVAEISEDTINENMTVLMPHLMNLVTATQDTIVREHHTSGYLEVSADAISFDAIVDKLESTGEGKLNKEKIQAWFDADVKDLITVAFADKWGYSDTPSEQEEKKLAELVTTYRNNYAALAGASSSFLPDTCNSMIKVLEVTEANSTSIGKRFVARLAKMRDKKEVVVESL